MLSALDWICAALLLASLMLGAWRGLVFELMSIAGWVLAFLVARWSADVVGNWLPMGESPEPLRYAAGFVLVFIAVAFLCGMLATLARQAAKALGVRPVDRVFGALFGALRGVLVLVVLAALVLMTPMREEDWWRGSLSSAWLEMTLSWLQPLLPASFGKSLSA